MNRTCLRLRGLAVAFALPLSLVAACGGDDDSGGGPTTNAPAAVTDPTASDPGTEPTTEAAAEASTAAPAASDSAAAPATGEPIVVGGMFNLSGPASVIGTAEFNGAQLAVEQINAGGGIDGRPLELDYHDVESSPDVAVTTARELVRDGVDVIIGPTLSSLCQAVREITEPADVLLYCISPIPPMSDLVFHMEYSPQAILGYGPARFMVDEGWTRVACLHAADVSGQAYLSTLQAAAGQYGFEVVAVESFQPGDADVTAQLTSIRGEDPDVVFSCASGGDHVTVLRGMEQLGMEQPVVLGAGGVSYEVAELAAEHLSPGGVFSMGSPVLVAEELPEDYPSRQRALETVAAYEEAYGERPSHVSGMAYDATLAVAEALRTAEDHDGPTVARALEAVCGLQGAESEYCYGPDNHSGAQLTETIIVRWTDAGGFALEALTDPDGIPAREPAGS